MSEENHSSDASPASGRLDEAAAYAELSRIVLVEPTCSEVLDEVALLARRALPEHWEVSVALSGKQIKINMADPDSPYPTGARSRSGTA